MNKPLITDWHSPDFAWLAPAKLNLFLHITGRRSNGYHELQSIFQFISYYDELYFSVTENGEIHRTSELPGVNEESDLVVRAARLLQRETGNRRGANIRVNKNIPMGGGLGGGSSDAATTLIALNKLWNTKLTKQTLCSMGLQLGADVPVFINGVAAWAEGVGEILSPVDVPEPWYVVISPNVHVNTGEIFSAPELTRDKHVIKIRGFLDGETENVCEPVVKKRYPAVAKALDWLAEYAPSRMTGTGACVFAAFDTEAQAKSCCEKVPKEWHAIYAKGMNTTPLEKLKS